MVDVPKTGEAQEDGESRELKLAQTDTKTKQESTITDENRQKTWQEAFDQGHENDQHPSEVQGMPALVQSSFGIDFGDGQILTAKGLEKKTVSPEQKTVSIGKTDYAIENVISRDLGAMLKKGWERTIQSLQNPDLFGWENPPKDGAPYYPHQGIEDDFIDYETCAKANKVFPLLAKYIGDRPGKIDSDLIAAIIRNEQFYYVNIKDTGPDNYIKAHGTWPFREDESIGPAQMQVRIIKYLAKMYPMQLGPVADAVRNAESKKEAPSFVGAYFSDVIHGIETKQKPDYISDIIWNQVNDHWQKGERNEALVIAYNPDPKQINHVFTQLDNIKAPDWD